MERTGSKAFIFESETPWEELGGGVRRQILGYDGQLMAVKVVFDKGPSALRTTTITVNAPTWPEANSNLRSVTKPVSCRREIAFSRPPTRPTAAFVWRKGC